MPLLVLPALRVAGGLGWQAAGDDGVPLLVLPALRVAGVLVSELQRPTACRCSCCPPCG